MNTERVGYGNDQPTHELDRTSREQRQRVSVRRKYIFC